MFTAMTASPEKVLSKITEPDFNNANEEHVLAIYNSTSVG